MGNNIKITSLSLYFGFKHQFHREPHRITNYLEDLSSSFHSFWNKGKDNDSLRIIHTIKFKKDPIKVNMVRII